MPASNYREYSSQYQEQCFEIWYSHGCPSSPKRTLGFLPEDEFGRKPTVHMIGDWMNEMNWAWRAEQLNAKVFEKANENLVVQQVEMMKRQAEYGFQMQKKAMEKLNEDGFDTSASAVNAIRVGVDIERTSRGVSKFLIDLVDKSDADIKEEIKQLSERVSADGNIIDVAEVENKNDTKSDIEGE